MTWAIAASAIWENGTGSYVPKTLDHDSWSNIIVQSGMTTTPTKADLLSAWVKEEGDIHWGSGYPKTPYRMFEGGADENGSLSFSQVLYKDRYGKMPCAAHSDQKLNLYDPIDQLKTMVIHSAANNNKATGSSSCWGGMHRGFSGTKPMREEYNQLLKFDNNVNQMKDFIGYIDNKTGSIVKRNQTAKEDDYETLAKAIAIYNGAKSTMLNFTWPRIIKFLKYKEKSKSNGSYSANSICHSCKYSIKVRNRSELFAGKLRRYVWEGGAYPSNLT